VLATILIQPPIGAAVTSTLTETCTETTTATTTSVETITITSTGGDNSSPPTSLPPYPPTNSTTQCINDEDADKMATVFQLLIQNYSDELALAALTTDFVDYSSSVNIIINSGAEGPKNITAPTFSGRQEFMDGQGTQPMIPFEKLQTFHGCDSVSLRWESTRSAQGQKTEVAAIVRPYQPIIPFPENVTNIHSPSSAPAS
jgi:hypothetical protein